MSELVAISYSDRQTAEVVRDILGELEAQHLIELEDAVVAARDRKGRLKLEQTQRPGRSRAARGAVAGGFLGLLFAAPALGAALGAAAAGTAGSMRDAGVDDDFAKELAAALEPPRAALVLLVREANGDKVLPEIREYGGHVIRTSLSSEAEASLRARLSAR